MSYQAMPPREQINFSTEFTAESYKLIPLYASESPKVQSQNDPPRYLKPSTWRRLWKTPTTMGAFFLLACIFAILHLVLFISLHKKRTDGPHSIPQSYVAAISHLFGLLFRASLSGSLAVAFTQYLWRIMRSKTIKVSSIEMLFKINRDPLLLLQPEVVNIAPILAILAGFTWLLPLAITFPPGALIVVSTAAQNISYMTVPTYNGSSVGNGSLASAELYSLAFRSLSGGQWSYRAATPSTRRIGRLVLELDDVIPFPSPCGPNCTYAVQFAGPYIKCDSIIINKTIENVGISTCEYNAFTASNMSTFDFDDINSEDRVYTTRYPFNISVSRSIYRNPESEETMLQEIESISCIPSWASYSINVTYKGGIHTITRSEKYMGSLRDMMVPVWAYTPANGVWSQPLLQTMTAFNHFALIDALISPLSGNYTMLRSGKYVSGGSSSSYCGPTNGTLVADTNLNTQRDNFTRTPSDGPSFAVSQDLLNDALFKLTMSAAFQLQFWNTSVPVSITNIHQVYSFASPKTLLIPYIICLLLSVPFLFLGLSSLRNNGVSAIEGGFLQVLMTTAGSKSLEKAAADGCLGGEENIPEDLKSMKIRFGELVSNAVDGEGDSRQKRRAGFGTEDEVMPLKRGIL